MALPGSVRTKTLAVVCLGVVAAALLLSYSPLKRKIHYFLAGRAVNALDYFDRAASAYDKSDYSEYLENMQMAVELAPGNPNFLYALARAYALKSRKMEALECLERAVRMGFYFSSGESFIAQDEDLDFNSIKDMREYQDLLLRIEESKAPVNNSRVAFVLPERDLMPESITYDSKGGLFYLGSLYKRKIVAADHSGGIRDFTAEKQDGLWGVTGLSVDAERGVLWANSSPHSKMRGFDPKEFGITGIFKYSLADGRLIGRYILDERPQQHLFNDLIVDSLGRVYITDSAYGAVYTVSEEKEDLELFIRKKDRFSKPNGIALSGDEENLYISHAEGISIFNKRTGDFLALMESDEISLTQIDGLYFYRGSLIAVQGNFRPSRVVRYDLGGRRDRVVGVDVIEALNPHFTLPTTGVIVGDTLYYIANSQLARYGENNTIFPLDELDEIVVLAVVLHGDRPPR